MHTKMDLYCPECKVEMEKPAEFDYPSYFIIYACENGHVFLVCKKHEIAYRSADDTWKMSLLVPPCCQLNNK